MGIGKCSTSCSQPIDMRSLDHRMATEIADPIILVINGDEKYVWLFSSDQDKRPKQDRKDGEEKSHPLMLDEFIKISRISEMHFRICLERKKLYSSPLHCFDQEGPR